MSTKKISLVDRINLDSLLPKEGNYTDLIIVKDLGKKLEVTQEEIKKYEIKNKAIEGGITTTWNKEKVPETFDIKFTELEQELVKKTLSELSDQKKLKLNQLVLHQLFNK